MMDTVARKRVFELSCEVACLKKKLKVMEQTFPWDLKRVSVDLPDHLRRTLTVIQKGSCTAEQVSQLTGRARAVESCYLNMLVNMKLAIKYRRGRKVVFLKSNESFEAKKLEEKK